MIARAWRALAEPGPATWRRLFNVVAWLVLAILTVLFAVRVEGRLSCQARYNDTMNARTVALTEATEMERQADRAEDRARAELVTDPAILKPAAGRTANEVERLRLLTLSWQRALTEEQHQQALADAERREHPVPPPPSELC